jgi:hypothetical protein
VTLLAGGRVALILSGARQARSRLPQGATLRISCGAFGHLGRMLPWPEEAGDDVFGQSGTKELLS